MSKLRPNLEALAAAPERETCGAVGYRVKPTGRLKISPRRKVLLAEVTVFDGHGMPKRGWIDEHLLEVRE
jgi:hypothetical protein